jgi:hypothetical protein
MADIFGLQWLDGDVDGKTGSIGLSPKRKKVGPKPGLKKSEVNVPFTETDQQVSALCGTKNENMKININTCVLVLSFKL